PQAQRRALSLATTPGGEPGMRQKMLSLLGELDVPDGVASLLKLIGGTEPAPIQLAALTALQHSSQDQVADSLLQIYPRAAGPIRGKICDVLLSHKCCALNYLRAADAGKILQTEITDN